MARGRQLARFQPYGIQPDLVAAIQPPNVWTRAVDVVFREGAAERVRGDQQVYGVPLFPPEWSLFTRDADEAPVWIYAAAGGVGMFDGAVHTDITPAIYQAPVGFNPWTGGILNSVPVLGNGLFYYWPGVGQMLPLPGWPALQEATAIRPFKFHLVAMGLVDAGVILEDAVAWSAAAPPGQVPQEWVPTPQNEAGSAQLSQSSGQVRDGAQLRGSFVLYKDTSTYLMDYVGGSTIMAVRQLFSQSGILGRNCVAEQNGYHYVLTDGDVVRHDGQNIVSIATDWVKSTLFDTIDGSNSRNAFVVSNYADSEIWFCIPQQGFVYPNLAAVFDTVKQVWGVRELPYLPASIAAGQVRLVEADTSWNGNPQPWEDTPQPWGASSGRVDYYNLLQSVAVDVGSFQFVDGAVTRNGTPVGSVLAKEKMTFGDHELVKTVKAVWLEIAGTVGTVLQVSMSGEMNSMDSPSYGPTRDFVVGVSRKVDLYATGRYLSIQITSNAQQEVEPWRLASFSCEFEPRGLY